MKPFFIWVALSLTFSGCLFDTKTDESTYLGKSGFTQNFNVLQKSWVDYPVVSAEIGHNDLPFSATNAGALGELLNSRQELFLRLASQDTSFSAWAAQDTSADWFLVLHPDTSFYNYFPAGKKFPVSDTVLVRYTWNFYGGMKDAGWDSLNGVSDSVWYEEMGALSQNAEAHDSLWHVIALDSLLDSMLIPLPKTLAQSISAQKEDFWYLDLNISLGESQQIYRVGGPAGNMRWPMIQANRVVDGALKSRCLADSLITERMAQGGYRDEEDPSRLVLHGGMRESLLVELPTEAIAQWLRSQSNYLSGQDEDSLNVEQFVLMAQIRFPSDTSDENNEVGIPVAVVISGLIDTIAKAGVEGNLLVESTVPDTSDIKKNGLMNLLYYQRDSVTFQMTETMRHYVQSMDYGSRLRFALRLGRPVWKPHETAYADSIYASYSSYSRWDLGHKDSLRLNVHLWIADVGGLQ